MAKKRGRILSISGFEPVTPKAMERMAAEHLVDVKTRNHPTVKKIRDAIMDEVMKAGTTKLKSSTWKR